LCVSASGIAVISESFHAHGAATTRISARPRKLVLYVL
jgi:hypothetical protein